MKCRFLKQDGSPRLIMLFAGWAADSKLFAGLDAEGYDLLAVWDYSDETLDIKIVNKYSEICVLAWSYGVYFASRLMERNAHLPFTARIAVNGTMHPVDMSYGISPEMFASTLNALDDKSLSKFYRRMCGGASRYNALAPNMPVRSLESVRGELANIGNTYRREGAPTAEWDYAYISVGDLIFPPESQRRAWDGEAEIVEIDQPHFPDFKEILGSAFIQKRGVTAAFSRSADTYDSNAPVQRQVANMLADKIQSLTPLSGQVVEIGPGSGFMSERLRQFEKVVHLKLIDVYPIDSSLPGEHIIEDAEVALMAMPDESVDAIVASSAVQWFNSPKNFFRQAYRVLRPGGVVAVSVYGKGTFSELPGLKSPSRVFEKNSLVEYVSSMFDVEELSELSVNQRFESSKELLRHFRLTGVSPISSSPSSVAIARHVVCQDIRTLTYNAIFLLLTKKIL